jgi:hypothetical protein
VNPKKWTEEYAIAFLQTRAHELSRTPAYPDVYPFGSVIGRVLGGGSFKKAQERAGLEPTRRWVKRPTPPPEPRGPSPLDPERAAFRERQERRRTESLARRILTNASRADHDGTPLPGLWSANKTTLRREILSEYENLSPERRAEILKAALRLQEEQAARIRHVPIDEYLGALSGALHRAQEVR